jgi:iron complex outermembrane receptor protein
MEIIFPRAFIVLSIFFFLPIVGNSATGHIHGTVKSNNKPIAGATIRLLELDRATRSDENGEFEFSKVPNGTYKVFVRIIGYAAATNIVIVNDNAVQTSFVLRESAIEAEEVIVSASPYAGTTGDQYQSAESKSAQELHESPGSSFSEKISDLPGVAVRYMGSAEARPILRGLSENEVLVLENGLRTGDVATFDPAHTTPIESEEIARIDVVRGPASVIYGPNAIGGLVNVITNTIPIAYENPFSGTLSLTGNSVGDEYTGFFNGVYSNGGHAFSISGGGVHSQDIRIPTGTYVDPASRMPFNLSRMPNTFDHTQEIGLGYSYQGDFGMIGIGAKDYEMNYGIPGVPPNDNWMTAIPSTSRITVFKKSLEFRSLLAVDGSLIKQIRLNANYVDYLHSEFPTTEDSSGIHDDVANNHHKKSFNAMFQFQHQQIGNFQGTVGLWMNTENYVIGGGMPLGPNSTTTDIAGYIFEEYLSGDNTRLQAGLRFDYNQIHAANSTDSAFLIIDQTRQSNAFSGSIGLIQKLSREITSSFSITRSFRAPTVQELFSNGFDAPSNSNFKGDSALTPETAVGIEASLKGNFTNVSFELTPYINLITNYIYPFLTGDSATIAGIGILPNRHFASTNARLTGFEASANFQLVQYLALRTSVDYVDAEDIKANMPLPRTPPMRGLLRLSYQDNMYAAMFEWRIVSAQNKLGDGDTPTAGYGIVNVGAGMRFFQGSVVHNISLHCDNLFNKAYRDNLSFVKDFLPQPGRGVRLNYNTVF